MTAAAQRLARATRQELARWITMSAPQSRRIGKLLKRAYAQAGEIGIAKGRARVEKAEPARLPAPRPSLHPWLSAAGERRRQRAAHSHGAGRGPRPVHGGQAEGVNGARPPA
jgi:hypothetical protein